jgi:hypothetical protein
MSDKNPPYCPKTRFATKADADFYIKKIQANPNKSGKVPVRAYLCNRCQTWHLTSQVDYVKQAEEQSKEIAALKSENTRLRAELIEARQEESKDLRKEVRVDQSVKAVKQQLDKAKRELVVARRNNGELLAEMLQLRKKLEAQK